MRMIEVHDLEGRSLFINPEQVAWIQAVTMEDAKKKKWAGSQIVVGPLRFFCREKPAQLLKLLAG